MFQAVVCGVSKIVQCPDGVFAHVRFWYLVAVAVFVLERRLPASLFGGSVSKYVQILSTMRNLLPR